MSAARAILIGLILIFAAGCGSGSDKGKNRDKDVPKSANQGMLIAG